MMDEKIILRVEGLYKKFSKDIKYNMIYGLRDLLINPEKAYFHLRKNEFWALNDINFDLYEGDILGFVGANGSGKTTLMRIISGIYPLEAGNILGLRKQHITSIYALRAGMEPFYTGRENIFIKGAMYGMTREEIEGKIDFILDFSELEDKIDVPFGNYSSGMRARLAYSIALATDPDIFIVDEALAVGDSVFKAKCFDNLKEFVQQPGKAVIFVSNNIRKVLKIATRVIVLDKGVIVHRSRDIKDALNFYILNCLKDLQEEHRQKKLQRIQDYDF